jgi:hypothetical protein
MEKRRDESGIDLDAVHVPFILLVVQEAGGVPVRV